MTRSIKNMKELSNIKNTITDKDILIIRQWFGFVYDVSYPCFLCEADYELARKLGIEGVTERNTSDDELELAGSKIKMDEAIQEYLNKTIEIMKSRDYKDKEKLNVRNN